MLGTRWVLIPALLCLPATASAQSPCDVAAGPYGRHFVFPFEWENGLQLGRGSTLPYVGSLRLFPTWVADRASQLRLGAILGAGFANPRGDVVVGGRVTRELVPVAPFGIGLHGALEASYGTSGRRMVALAAIFDAGNVAEVILRATRDVHNDVTYVSLGLGSHLENFIRSRIRDRPVTAPQAPAEEFGDDYLGEVAHAARNAMSDVFLDAINADAAARRRNQAQRDRHEGGGSEPTDRCPRLERRASGLVQAIEAADTTVAILRAHLAGTLFARTDSLIDDHGLWNPRDGAAERDVVRAVARGFRAALGRRR